MLEFKDSDGDTVRFILDPDIGLGYYVNGVAKVAPVTQLKADGDGGAKTGVTLRLAGTAMGPWPGERRTSVPAATPGSSATPDAQAQAALNLFQRSRQKQKQKQEQQEEGMEEGRRALKRAQRKQ